MQRTRARRTEPLQALVTGREDVIEQAWWREAAPLEDGRARARGDQAKPPDAPGPPPVRVAPAQGVRRLLGSRRSLRQAMLAYEILGPPRALRPEDRTS